VDALSGAPVPTPYEPQSPPISQELVEELRRLETEKGTALDEKRFEDAATLRDRERRLSRAARELDRAWRNEPPPPPKPRLGLRGRRAQPPPLRSRRMPRRVSSYDLEPVRLGPTPALVVGWALFGLALGIGILIGWAIWG
jgi:UvrB/uvrC motif